jgi:broad specificity phosphatase PhoE
MAPEPGGRAPRLLLARHGQTDANIDPLLFQGMLDVPLNDTGRRQAAELAEEVAGMGIRSLWASPLSRARETAEIVGERIGLAPILDERLMEGHRGRWEGHRMRDVAVAEPERYADWRGPAPGFRFPGGETLQEHLERVEAALADIATHAELPALVVCHGGTIRTALCARDPRGLAAFHEFEIPNVAVVPIDDVPGTTNPADRESSRGR